MDGSLLAQSGLIGTLSWILNRITQCNHMVDELLGQIPADASQSSDKESSENGRSSQDDPPHIMKRRIDISTEDALRPRDERIDFTSDARPHTRRRSVATGPSVGESSTTRSQLDYNQSLHPLDSQVSRISVTNPSPTPNRQLSSPPGHPFPLAPVHFPSPSTSHYGNVPQDVSLPLPSNLHQPATSIHLPPISAAHSRDSALQEHSAALQHEVSVQKIALSSLQGEHDKLLAALSRSQIRASALEKKHAVSDNEIITLTEEKLRLQTQVIELERDVEELSRSRNEYRQAAVQEGLQYVEIVKKASQLEEMAGDERRAWNRCKEDMERRIEVLSGARNKDDSTGAPASTAWRVADDMIAGTPAALAGSSTNMNMDPLTEASPAADTYHPSTAQSGSAEDLKEGIRRLRERCTRVENALRSIRDANRSMEGLINASLERADSTLRE